MVTELVNWNYQKIIGPYTGWNQDFTTLEKSWVFSEKGDPWGDLSAPEATSDSSFLSLLSNLIKYRENIRIKNTQNHFKSTFGSVYLISRKMKLKLAKQAEKEPRKARFPWDLGFLFVQPIKITDIEEYWNYWAANETTLIASYEFFNKLLAKLRQFS